MPDLPADFDLKLMPDWLKEPAGKNPYADYQGGDDDRRSRGGFGGDFGGRGRQDDRRGRPGGQRPGGGPRDDSKPRRDSGRRDDRGPRRDAPGAPRKPDAKRPDRPQGRPDDRRGGPAGDRRSDAPRRQDAHDRPPAQPANVTIEFFPDESCAVSIARQVKSTHRAYSLFDLARMFLARPERHRLKIATKTVAEPLFQVGEGGPIFTDRAAAERAAFPIARDKFYVEVTEQREAPKGNFSNVARCRLNGILLGPTNYHGYQPALRKLFEERFSRRMSFSDFQRDIEVVTDPAVIEQWKQQASSVTVYRLKPPEAPKKPGPVAVEKEEPVAEVPAEAAPVAESVEDVENAPLPVEATPEEPATEPVAESAEPAPEAQPAEETPAAYEGPIFTSLTEVERHFRESNLPSLIRTASSLHVSGEVSRAISDRGIAAAVRQAWEQERGFPGQMMHQLRQHFSRAGLHVFKHRKRMQFVSLIRPSPMEGGSLSPTVAEILQVIQGSQNCTRVSLAAAILGADEATIDPARKSALATDLHWLIETGRVIEFAEGRLELPVVPAKPEPAKKEEPAATVSAEPAPATSEPVTAEAQPPLSEPVPEIPAAEEAHAPEIPVVEEAPAPVAEIVPAPEEEQIAHTSDAPAPSVPVSVEAHPESQPETSSI